MTPVERVLSVLRFHFSAEDLARTRVAAAPHALWEIAASLHRFQTPAGRWAYAHWYRTARERLREAGLESAVRQILLPLYPRASYWPDFLTPLEGAAGLEAGLKAILATPPARVTAELATLARIRRVPPHLARLPEKEARNELVSVLRAYHRAVIEPHEEWMHEGVHTERVRLARHSLDGGTDGLLGGLGPAVRWHHPRLEIGTYPTEHDIRLQGRGLLLIPSYFCWKGPVSLADPALPRSSPTPSTTNRPARPRAHPPWKSSLAERERGSSARRPQAPRPPKPPTAPASPPPPPPTTPPPSETPASSPATATATRSSTP